MARSYRELIERFLSGAILAVEFEEQSLDQLRGRARKAVDALAKPGTC